MNEQSTNISEGVLVVTQEQYEQMINDGIDDETLLKPGTYKLRRRNLAPKEKLQSLNAEIKLTVELDSDIAEHFKRRAGETTARLQTLVNQELRAAMERDRQNAG